MAQYASYSGYGGSSGGGGVSSINTLTGPITLAAGTGLTLSTVGSTLTFNDVDSSGSVTSVSVVSANGLAGTVATPTTTPAITLSTTVTGILYGNGTSIAAAIAGEFPTLNQNTTGTASNITASSNSTLTTLSALSLPYSQVTGTPSALLFADSLVNTAGTVTLVNDSASPTASQYYGTNVSSTLGYYNLPATGTGTVTSVSVVSANGLAGTVATATTTPAITLSTTVTGLLKGNGTAISAATAGTDYVIPSGSITGTASNITGSSNSTLTTLSALSLPYSQVTGTPTPLVFADSLVNTAGTVTLVNDSASPGASQYYGTNAGSVLGYYPVGSGSANPIQLTQISTPATPPSGSNDLYFKATTSSGVMAESLTTNGLLGAASAPTQFIYQSFIPTITANIVSAVLKLDYTGALPLTGSLVAEIYTDSAGSPGTLLETSSSVNAATITTSSVDYTFTFAGTTSLTSGTLYYVVLDTSGVTFNASTLQAAIDSTDPYPSGQAATSSNSGTTWVPDVGNDLYFIINTTPTTDNGLLYTLNSLGVETLVSGSGTITSWKNDLTFTLSAGFGTVTNQDIWYRRVGDSMEIKGSFTNGTTSASTAYLQLPASYNVDTAKIPSQNQTTSAGFAFRLGSSTVITTDSTGQCSLFIDTGNTNQLFFTYNASGNAFAKVNANVLYNASENIALDMITIPIVGW